MKKCTICQTDKEFNQFNKKNTTKDGLQNVCRECNKTRSKQYYKDNLLLHRKNIYRRKALVIENNTNFIKNIKAKGCSICDEKSICCLDFHHLDKSTKEYSVSFLQGAGYSLSTIKTEIDKCILVCSNCHRKIHANEISLI